MGIELSKEVKNLVDRPNFGHLATLMPDGSPHSAPVWLGREGDYILVITEGSSLKGKNTLRDPRVSLSIVAFSQKYIGKPWPYRDEGEPIVLVIEADKAKFSKQPFEHTPPAG